MNSVKASINRVAYGSKADADKTYKRFDGKIYPAWKRRGAAFCLMHTQVEKAEGKATGATTRSGDDRVLIVLNICPELHLIYPAQKASYEFHLSEGHYEDRLASFSFTSHLTRRVIDRDGGDTLIYQSRPRHEIVFLPLTNSFRQCPEQ